MWCILALKTLPLVATISTNFLENQLTKFRATNFFSDVSLLLFLSKFLWLHSRPPGVRGRRFIEQSQPPVSTPLDSNPIFFNKFQP